MSFSITVLDALVYLWLFKFNFRYAIGHVVIRPTDNHMFYSVAHLPLRDAHKAGAGGGGCCGDSCTLHFKIIPDPQNAYAHTLNL